MEKKFMFIISDGAAYVAVEKCDSECVKFNEGSMFFFVEKFNDDYVVVVGETDNEEVTDDCDAVAFYVSELNGNDAKRLNVEIEEV